jgi:hypothetical protein
MKKGLIILLTILFLFSTSFIACSEKQESQPEKGAVEKLSDKTSKEISDRMLAPLDRAKEAGEKAQDKINEEQKEANK